MNFNYPKISIITPSFNQGTYIEQTILSIIGQGYPNLEYIIIDGGSTDNTVDIIKKYEQHISYWESKPDKGQSDALNKGLSKCTGEIFNWLNSDDYLEPGALNLVAKAFRLHPNTLQVCGYTRIFEDSTNATQFTHRCEFFENIEKTIVQQRINQPASFYNLLVVKELGGINTSLDYVMDLELWFRFLCKHGQSGVILLNDVLAHFRLHKSSKTFEYQERFMIEGNGLFFYMLESLGASNGLKNYFPKNEKYISQKWPYEAVNAKQFFKEISESYFYNFYNKGDYAASRIAFRLLLSSDKIPINRNTLRMFVRSFLGF